MTRITRILFLCSFGILVRTAQASPAPIQDPNDDIFTASQVVIVSSDKPYSYTVERTYLGNLVVGSCIDLPSFKLVTWDKMGREKPQPITNTTRILLFLQPDEKNPAAFAVTYYGEGFFFRDADRIDELDVMARNAINMLQKWQAARDLPDRQERIRALFAYLLHSAPLCSAASLGELEKLNPDSGDYLASQLATASSGDCSQLLSCLCQGKLHSPRAHAAAVGVVDRARSNFTSYLSAHHLQSLDVRAHWNDLSEDLKDGNGIIYYGLAAIRSFGDKSDAPYFRGMVPFLLANDQNQAIEECVYAMQDNPAPENLPLLKSIWEDFKSHHYPAESEPLLPIYLCRALSTQNDSGAIPILLELLDDHFGQDSAIEALRKVTAKDPRLSGTDLWSDAQWKSWYAKQ